ncbi:hypothetical protein RFI_36517 [Reticulomyxa filosa]|uniref:Uncharacterized protein n=1 Tax=Reticulomyxa filosa TaxID=46433 RepID=X6LG33_RETFI|nr:hypothetical protein RFI_36517 [Reticulomyxa filosa]|eukprot:ETO00923.1 hypothetical protein RFI_36517 [Reticulomyxa filosa]
MELDKSLMMRMHMKQQDQEILLGIIQKQLKEVLIENSLLYWTAGQKVQHSNVYEKGLKELQAQLTTYWDYITAEELKHKCPELMDDWSCSVVDRLMNLKSISSNSCCEMSLVVGHEEKSQ